MEHLAETLKDVPIEYRPELRWWLAAGGHTDQTIKYEISRAHELGFGGMEFLAMDEAGVDNARYGWGSEEWNHSSQLVADETTKRNMSVSFTSGTNWANANLPTIDADHPAAAKELNVVTEDIKAGSKRSGKLPRIDIHAFLTEKRHGGNDPRIKINKQNLIGVVAARILEEGEIPVLDSKTLDLTAQVVNDNLEWGPEEGTWRIFFFWIHGSGQIATPSQSINYTVNYFDRDGVDEVIKYWDSVVLTPELRATISENPRAQMYMDSLELFPYGAAGLLWGHTMLSEFEKRRGYSVVPYLPFMVRKIEMLVACTAFFLYEPTAAERQTIEKVRFDLVRTFTDLYIENMMKPFREYLNKTGILLRSEISYGLPLELTRPAAHVDGLETESLEFGSQIDAYRLMSGAAHLLGKQYSSETGATSRNLMLEHRFYDQIIYTQLAAGITKTVLHGWSSVSGAEGNQWPGHEGMLPVFSERFDDRQPGREFYPLWNQAIGRMQYILRQGLPRIDIGILRTDHSTDSLCGLAVADDEGYRVPDEITYATWWMRNRENHWWQDLGMQDAGWTYEFFDGLLLMDETVGFDSKTKLVQPKGPGYQALIVYQSTLDPDVAKHLLSWAKDGLKILFVHDTRELKYLKKKQYYYHPKAASSTQGLDGRDKELAEAVRQMLSLPNVREVSKPDQTLDALRQLGVQGRAEFARPNTNILSHIRRDGDLSYVFLYHFLYESGKLTEVEVCFDGQGAVARVDPWAAKIEPYHDCVTKGGRTHTKVNLQPGEVIILCLDRSKEPIAAKTLKRSKVTDISKWSVVVEDWDAGEIEVIKEDRGQGYETIEHRPSTKVTKIDVGETKLVSWKDMPKVGPHVSGVAEYRATFDLSDIKSGKLVLHLGSTCGGLGSVQVNGQDPRGFDTSGLEVDLTGLVRTGPNEIVVRVSSALNNRLKQRGYYEKLIDGLAGLYGEWKKGDERALCVRDHGLLGPVQVLREEWR